MRKDLKNAFQRGSFFGMGLASVIIVSSALAITISGTINVFTSGEVLTAAKLNENFTSLKTAIESLSSPVDVTSNISGDCTSGKTNQVEKGSFNSSSPNFFPMIGSGTIKSIKFMITSNFITGAGVVGVQIKKNGVNTGLVIPSITSTTTAGIISVPGTISYAAGDKITFVFLACSPSSSGSANGYFVYEY